MLTLKHLGGIHVVHTIANVRISGVNLSLWDQTLSLETCLGSVYSVDMFRGSISPV